MKIPQFRERKSYDATRNIGFERTFTLLFPLLGCSAFSAFTKVIVCSAQVIGETVFGRSSFRFLGDNTTNTGFLTFYAEKSGFAKLIVTYRTLTGFSRKNERQRKSLREQSTYACSQIASSLQSLTFVAINKRCSGTAKGVPVSFERFRKFSKKLESWVT